MMKINQIIREKRRELSLTQEQVAEYLGISAPAVHKWEKGSTYPDITLLPALARLLKTDLNTLMSFQEDLTEIEIENFVEELHRIAQEQGYKTAFEKGMDKLYEYPTCEELIYSVVLYLEGALFLCRVQQREPYQEKLLAFYQRLSASENPEIRDTALAMLICYARNKGEFSKAEELIDSLPFSTIDKKQQLAVLYQQQKDYEKAEKIWVGQILNSVTNIQSALASLAEIALSEQRAEDAKLFADLYATLTRTFRFPSWMYYNMHLQLALAKKDPKQSLAILEEMLPAMKQEWTPRDFPLYRCLNKDGGTTFFSGQTADILYEELSSKEEYSFLNGCPEYQERLDEIMEQCHTQKE